MTSYIFNYPVTTSSSGAIEYITSSTLAGANTNIDLSGIGTDYKWLLVKGMVQVTTACEIDMTFNGDTGNNYATEYLQADGAAINAAATGARANCYVVYVPANTPVAVEIYISNDDGYPHAVQTRVGMYARGMWNFSQWTTTDNITSIRLTANGQTFKIGSTLSVYGATQ